MTHFVLLQHVVLQNMHWNNKHKSLQRNKIKNTQTSYKKIKYMHTYNTVPCKHSPCWEVNYFSFAFLSHFIENFMPSCYTYMTWLLQLCFCWYWLQVLQCVAYLLLLWVGAMSDWWKCSNYGGHEVLTSNTSTLQTPQKQ